MIDVYSTNLNACKIICFLSFQLSCIEPLFHAYGSGSRTADNCMEDLQAITDANNKNQLIEKILMVEMEYQKIFWHPETSQTDVIRF